ncbi:MAG: hypothetical protein M3Y37_11335 [Chloroflexota bacterium]|nr:hypothetical protein [Chloroflexota bacterium]
MSDGVGRIIRSLLQLIAGGGLTALFLQLAEDVPESYAPYLVLLGTGLVAVAQILVEELTGTAVLRAPAGPIDRVRTHLR